MKTEQDLISKLMISKKIMEKHNTMGRTNSQHTTIERPEVETFEAPSAKYNLPEEYLQETTYTPKNTQPVTEDRIMSSKLPDEIKKLMIEHPINQPSHTTSPTLSNELVEKASRLMGVQKQNVSESKKQNGPLPKHIERPSIDKSEIASIVRETVEEVLRENGLLIESTQRTKDNFTFKVGNHIFEGKLTKIKKVS